MNDPVREFLDEVSTRLDRGAQEPEGRVAVILGIDPGARTGWALYDSAARRVLAAGMFEEHLRSPEFTAAESRAEVIVIERPMGYGPTYPQVVDAAWIAGQLAAHCGAQPITRRDIKRILTAATQRDVVVKDDASAWAALKLVHGGDDAAKKGGCLHGVRSHERAALAVAVAWALREATAKGAPS